MSLGDDLTKFMILQHLNEWDPMTLSPGRGEKGAPYDEYLDYATSISQFLKTQSSLSGNKHKELVAHISSQFAQAFEIEIEKLLSDPELSQMAKSIAIHHKLLRLNRPNDFR